MGQGNGKYLHLKLCRDTCFLKPVCAGRTRLLSSEQPLLILVPILTSPPEPIQRWFPNSISPFEFLRPTGPTEPQPVYTVNPRTSHHSDCCHFLRRAGSTEMKASVGLGMTKMMHSTEKYLVLRNNLLRSHCLYTLNISESLDNSCTICLLVFSLVK